MVEYWLDLFDDKPLEVHRNADGFIQLKDTGDTLIDKWEKKIASGEEPDLWESFSPEARAQLESLQKRAKKAAVHGGFTMQDTMERIEKDARLQGLKPPVGSEPPSSRFHTFGDGTD